MTHPDDELIDETAAAALAGVSMSALRMRRLRGDGPPSARVGARSVVYRRADVLEWIAKRDAERAERRAAQR